MSAFDADKGSRSIRVLEVLEAVVAADRPLSVSEIVAATGLPKATIHRLCVLLQDEGFLSPDMGGKGLSIGYRTSELALAAIAAEGQQTFRRRVLLELSREVGETCNLAIPVAGEMIYLDRVESEWPLRMQLPIGSRVPLHCSAAGKLFLSSLPAARRKRMIGQLHLVPYTPSSITNPQNLEAELKRVRRNKVGTDNQEFIDGMVAAAVAVEDRYGRIAAALSFHAPLIRMTMAQALEYVPALRRAASALSADIVAPA